MAGIRIKADEEGVALLNAWADGLEDNAEQIVSQTEQLLDDVSGYPALGPHQSSIKRIVAAIQEETKGTTAPVRVVSEKLRNKAKDYQDWIDDDLFGGDSGN